MEALVTDHDLHGEADKKETVIREEYVRMSRDFRMVVRGYGFDLSGSIWNSMDLVMAGCECLDRVVDDITDRDERIETAQKIVKAIASGETGESGLSDEVCHHLELMDEIWKLLNCRAMEAELGRKIYAISEELREVTSRSEYIQLVGEEGRCFLEMFVPFLEGNCPGGFLQFFRKIGEAGNLVDKLVDARADAARGEHRLNPGWWHHLRLFFAVAGRMPGIMRVYPNRALLFRWAGRYFLPHNHVSARVESKFREV